MPAEPIEFRIAKSLKAAAQLMKTADGYHHTVKLAAVKLDREHKVEDLIGGANEPIGPPRPFVILDLSRDATIEYFPANQMRLGIAFALIMVHDSDPTDDDARMKTYYELNADAEQALAADITRGGLAVDTRVTGRQMHEHDGQLVTAIVSGVVNLHREYGKPNG